MDVDLQIEALRRPNAPLWAIHYACESWYHVTDRPVAVSCIALVRLSDRSTHVFSQTDAKEDPEKSLFTRFYDHLRANPDAILIHWNMHSSDFGFEALRNRYRYLFSAEPPFSPSEANRIDLDSLIASKYGGEYADHPKLSAMGDLNGFSKRYMLSGKEEAEKFGAAQHGDVRRSTTEKALLVSFLLGRLLSDKLVTKNSVSSVVFAGRRLDAVRIVEQLGERFEYVKRQLTKRHGQRATLIVSDEYDFQDLYHSLLRVFFDDVREEEWVPSYAGASSRIDFVLPEARLALELKHARATMTAKTLGDELLVDSQRYSKHPQVDTLVCIVLDPEGRIANPRGIEHDLTKVAGGLKVVVKIIDR
jgi:hypothetical protein